MSDAWFDRLLSALEGSERSMREISLAAGCGPNYLQQLVKNKKKPTVNRLLDIMREMGTASTLYILTGAEFTSRDEEFLRLVLSLDSKLRAEALGLFRVLREREVRAEPPPLELDP